jgi:hypothetical protein
MSGDKYAATHSVRRSTSGTALPTPFTANIEDLFIARRCDTLFFESDAREHAIFAKKGTSREHPATSPEASV